MSQNIDVTVEPSTVEQDAELFRTWLVDQLKSGTVTVKFTKADGTDRVMNCTLNKSLLPPVVESSGTARQRSTSSLSVFDVDLQAWRSFTLSSVHSVQFKFARGE